MMNKLAEYELILKQVEAIASDESDIIANMANISALLFESLSDVNWVGFYRVLSDELVLGPFQGKVACIRIPLNKGVCGSAAVKAKTIRVANVHDFSGHIACDANSNSEIVVPLIINDKVVAVLDIDSPIYERFDEDDQTGLENIINLFENIIIKHGVIN
ncbi:GAF domain-containing protein [Colwellia sp. UCD-KL20]|uniref:GAF domain-containing protein n=1 Tax=Colwellia sp. UCD-KL20 TaxID=1917165 RepID=UPI001C4DA130|nr:GAF domain-containing protein [Colwellia sp. UCD-KL20]